MHVRGGILRVPALNTVIVDRDRELLRHFLAAIAYRTQKPLLLRFDERSTHCGVLV